MLQSLQSAPAASFLRDRRIDAYGDLLRINRSDRRDVRIADCTQLQWHASVDVALALGGLTVTLTHFVDS